MFRQIYGCRNKSAILLSPIQANSLIGDSPLCKFNDACWMCTGISGGGGGGGLREWDSLVLCGTVSPTSDLCQTSLMHLSVDLQTLPFRRASLGPAVALKHENKSLSWSIFVAQTCLSIQLSSTCACISHNTYRFSVELFFMKIELIVLFFVGRVSLAKIMQDTKVFVPFLCGPT